MNMTVSLSGLLHNAAQCLKSSDKKWHAYYAACLADVADHIAQVQAGKISALDFCDHYNIAYRKDAA